MGGSAVGGIAVGATDVGVGGIAVGVLVEGSGVTDGIFVGRGVELDGTLVGGTAGSEVAG